MKVKTIFGQEFMLPIDEVIASARATRQEWLEKTRLPRHTVPGNPWVVVLYYTKFLKQLLRKKSRGMINLQK